MLGVLLFLAASGAPVEAGAVSTQTPLTAAAPAVDEDGLLLFALRLETLTLSDSMAAYGDPSDPLVPVGELARLLDLDIDVSPADQRIEGRIGEAATSLVVDLKTQTARLGGTDLVLTADDVAVARSDIFIRASALQRILPIKLQVDGEALSIEIIPTGPLPIQARMERIARLRSLGRDVAGEEELTRIESPYELFAPPAFDLILESGSDTRGNRFSRRFDIRAAGDLLQTGFQGFIGSDDRGRPSEARILFERRSLTGGLLGPLDATRVSGGDVFTPALSLGARSVAGRGISFTTAPLEQASVFDTIDLRGELPIGTDVELYINDVLRSGQRAPVQGRYEFLDVPLVRGINLIRIVSYGPRGDRSEQVRVVNVGGGQLKKGQVSIDVGLVQQDRPLFSLRRGAIDASFPGAGELRVVGSLAYGLSEALTVVAGAASLSTSGQRRQVLTAGVRTGLLGLAAHGDAAIDDKGGRALSIGLAGRPLGVSMVAGHFEYRGGFVDENQNFGDVTRRLSRHSEVTFDFSMPAIGGKVIPISVRGLRDGYADGGSNWIAGARASRTFSNTLVSTGFDYQRTTVRGAPLRQQLAGNIAASRFLGYKWQLRGVLDYDLLPGADLRAISLTADRSVSDRAALRFGIGHLFQKPAATSLQAGATLRTRFGDVALTGDLAVPRRDWSIGLRFAFGLAHDGGRYRVTSPGVASGGSAAFRSFIDRNGNGGFDPGEDGVPNVSLEGSERPLVTDATGRAFVVGLGSGPTARLRVGTERIENFYVSAPPATVEFSPRPGKVLQIAYPITPTGEVLVRLLFRRDREAVGLSAVRLRLVREGADPTIATTEFDGTAVFATVPAGEYRLELDPSQAERLRMKLAAPVVVTVTADGKPSNDVDAEVAFDNAPGGGD
jgi:hypothetical protein